MIRPLFGFVPTPFGAPAPVRIYTGGAVNPNAVEDWTADTGTLTQTGNDVYATPGTVGLGFVTGGTPLDGTFQLAALADSLVYITDNGVLASLDFSGGAACPLLNSIFLATATTFQSLIAGGGLPALDSFYADGVTSITSLDFTGCAVLRDLTCRNTYDAARPSGIHVVLPVSPALVNVELVGGIVSVAEFNAMLQALDASGVTGGYLSIGVISGPSQPAPTGAGITAKNNLIAKGWNLVIH